MSKPGKKREYREALISMVEQFAFRTKLNGLPAFTTGGLSALEEAFFALGWDDPEACIHNACFLCCEFATCGTNMPKKYTVWIIWQF